MLSGSDEYDITHCCAFTAQSTVADIENVINDKGTYHETLRLFQKNFGRIPDNTIIASTNEESQSGSC